MEKQQSDTFFRDLKNDLTEYIELKLELLKLNTYERSGRVIAILSYGLILLFFAFFAILFIFIALSYYLGDLLDSYAAGFGIVAGLYLVMLAILMLNKQRIQSKVLNVIIAALMANETKTEQPHEESPTEPFGEIEF